MLYKLGRWCFRRAWLVIATWVLIFAAAGAGAFFLAKPFSSQFRIENTPSINAAHTLVDKFHTNPIDAPTVTIVFHAPDGLDAHADAVEAVIQRLDKYSGDRFGNPLTHPIVEEVTKAYVSQGLPRETAERDAANLSLVSEDRTTAYTTFDLYDGDREAVAEALQAGRDAGITVEAGGQGYGEPIKIKTTSEIVGIGVAFIVLMVLFRSFVASVIPLVTAVVGVGLGLCVIFMTTHFTELTDVTPTLAVMIGLAVGIDYALFIIARYRAEGGTREHAAGRAVETAGSAVVFAGATVVIALAALSVAGIGFLTAMGLLAAVTVTLAVVVALTLVPALLGVVKDIRRAPNEKPTRWITFVKRFPGVVVAAVIISLGAMSYPVTHLEMALPSDSTAKPATTQRKSADLLADAFGPGINAPFLVIVDAANARPLDAYPTTPQFGAFMYTVDQLDAMAGVKNAQLAAVTDDAAQILVTPYTGPTDQETVRLSHALRARADEIAATTGATIGLTGLTAVQMDITEKLAGAMPLYLGLVVGLAIILLFIIFRSVLIPLVAGLGFLLSVGAAFGITILVWDDAPLISFMPIFLIGVTFGLAMDYQVFLVSAMREHHSNGIGDPIVAGFNQGARVVTAAALIMIAVFVAFIDQTLPFIQIFGFALGVGVLFDAFFVRMALIPASMFLMGRATWWGPTAKAPKP